MVQAPHHPRVQLIEGENYENGWSFLALGRMISRFSGYMYLEFFPNWKCLVDGANEVNGKTWYDFGLCSGTLFMEIFDVTIG